MLTVDLAADGARLAAGVALAPEPFHASDAALDRVGRLSGSALATALLLERARGAPDADAPLVLAVGTGVRRGLPTAARVTLASRAPLSGLYAEGQVGTDLGARLARLCDALVLDGRVPAGDPGRVLVLSGDDERGARARLLALPGIAALAPADVAADVRASVGPCAVLCTGPAAEAGVPFASLAACGDPPSFVGRGGLGAVLARLGLKALAVVAEPVAPPVLAEGDELRRRLAASPRLRARSEGGTLEQASARAARGELERVAEGVFRRTPAQLARERDVAARLVHDASERALERKGCRGCPTPCGWTFGTPGEEGPGRGAHFSALDALGLRLGLERFEDVHALLGRCDALGVDAKEVGLGLALLCEAHERGSLPGPSPRGDRASLERVVAGLVEEGANAAPGLALGADALARAHGLDATTVKGQAARPERSVAGTCAQCVSSRGADPMRALPFLVGEGVALERAAELLAPYPITRAALEADDPRETGRVVAWHEDLAAAVDATGFCAFSAAGLLTDGVCTLDELAEWIAPEAARAFTAEGAGPGRALLAAGASIVLAQRELNARWGAAPDADRPAWARARLDLPGVWDEYRAVRGLDAAGRPTAEALARAGTAAVLELGLDELRRRDRSVAPDVGAAAVEPRPSTAGGPDGATARHPGRVTLRAFGPLARELGTERTLELALPARVADVLEAAARAAPGAGRWLLRDGRPVPAVTRAGRRLEPDDAVADGDALDLVLAISGGAP